MSNRTNLTTLRVISVFLVAMAVSATVAGGTIYVDADAGGTNNGSSWTDAYRYLQNGLAAAWSGDEIRVAQGIYKPDEDSAHPNGIGSRTATFRLKNGVAIKGGYAGFGEPDPNARDIEAYETILSGDLLGDDGPGFANNGENSYHVVTGSGTDETAILDGFTITSGNGGDGGGMYNQSSSPTVTNCTFTRNLVTGSGGGMKNGYGSSPILTNCRFSENSAGEGGGLFYWSGTPRLTRCTFSDNSAIDRGGGMFSRDNGDSSLDTCAFYNNSAERDGGGIYNYLSNAVLNNCTFSGNKVTSSHIGEGGGGMANIAGSVTLTNCSFSDNLGDKGGGVYNWEVSEVLINCTFIANSAIKGGGLYSRTNSDSTLINCAFYDNSAEDSGGGMYDYQTSPVLINCNFVANWAVNCGGGIQISNSSNPTLTNCILWSNSDSGGVDELAQLHIDNGTPVINYSCLHGWTGHFGGMGNHGADPLFVDTGHWVDPNTPDVPSDDVWVMGNYHLLSGSPCIDAGDNSAVPPLIADDLDGNPRFVDDPDVPDTGNGAPPVVDMGAYEGSYQGFLLSAESVIVPEGGTATFTVMLAVDPLETVEVTVAVESGDPDIIVQSGASLSFDSSNYSVPQTVTVAASEDEDRFHSTALISVSAIGLVTSWVNARELDNEPNANILFVDQRAAGANNGISWIDAFVDLQDALDAAEIYSQFEEIRVAHGIYTPAGPSGDRRATFRLVNNVAIRGGYAGFGEPSPDARDIELYETVLSGDLLGNDGPDFANNGENSYNVVTGSGTNATAVLCGFIITGGNGGSGAGMYNDSGSPTISNCTFSGNLASGRGGGMYNYSSSSPKLTNCTFIGNSARELGGGMNNFDSSDPMLTGCIFSNNSARHGGGVWNGGMWYSGGSSPTLTNCVFSCNKAEGDRREESGGGMRNQYGSSPILINCVFSGNLAARWGGGMSNEDGSPTVSNCTFVGNWADEGGGISNHWSSLALTNCILWSNSDSDGMDESAQIHIYECAPTVNYCCIKGWSSALSGIGSVDLDPCFVEPGYWDANDVWVDGDYHLLPGSPCIESGDNTAVPEDAFDLDGDGNTTEPIPFDLDGNPRIVDGNKDGNSVVDMGAYEFFNTPPVACIVGGSRIAECEGCWGARVTLDGSCSSDADSTPGTNDDIVCFDWYKVDACDPNFEDFLGSGEVIDCNLPLGEHIIVLEVTDRTGAFDTNEVTIIVQDTTPPDFTLSVTPDVLWPVNHKMVLITPSWTASDICDESPEVSLVSITMNEGDEATGDGHTTDDIQVDDNGSIYLRAERSGTGSGRIYTITYQAVDDSGNIAVASATVTVPHDQR